MKVQRTRWPAAAAAVTGILTLMVLSGGDVARPAGVSARASHVYIVQARSAAEAPGCANRECVG